MGCHLPRTAVRAYKISPVQGQKCCCGANGSAAWVLPGRSPLLGQSGHSFLKVLLSMSWLSLGRRGWNSQAWGGGLAGFAAARELLRWSWLSLGRRRCRSQAWGCGGQAPRISCHTSY